MVLIGECLNIRRFNIFLGSESPWKFVKTVSLPIKTTRFSYKQAQGGNSSWSLRASEAVRARNNSFNVTSSREI